MYTLEEKVINKLKRKNLYLSNIKDFVQKNNIFKLELNNIEFGYLLFDHLNIFSNEDIFNSIIKNIDMDNIYKLNKIITRYANYPYNLLYTIMPLESNTYGIHKFNINELDSTLNSLFYRQKEVLLMKYKLKETSKKCAEKFGISSCRFLQIENDALRKMRQKCHSLKASNLYLGYDLKYFILEKEIINILNLSNIKYTKELYNILEGDAIFSKSIPGFTVDLLNKIMEYYFIKDQKIQFSKKNIEIIKQYKILNNIKIVEKEKEITEFDKNNILFCARNMYINDIKFYINKYGSSLIIKHIKDIKVKNNKKRIISQII